jgi:hypothetical protein
MMSNISMKGEWRFYKGREIKQFMAHDFSIYLEELTENY